VAGKKNEFAYQLSKPKDIKVDEDYNTVDTNELTRIK
jgi:hypothetical protein